MSVTCTEAAELVESDAIPSNSVGLLGSCSGLSGFFFGFFLTFFFNWGTVCFPQDPSARSQVVSIELWRGAALL